ncbi:hypothetical protein D3C75_273150 [compost metagenome]
MAKEKPEEGLPAAKAAPKFAVQQLLASKQFSGIEKDVLRGVLSAGQEYTLDEARAAIKAYTERVNG